MVQATVMKLSGSHKKKEDIKVGRGCYTEDWKRRRGEGVREGESDPKKSRVFKSPCELRPQVVKTGGKHFRQKEQHELRCGP